MGNVSADCCHVSVTMTTGQNMLVLNVAGVTLVLALRQVRMYRHLRRNNKTAIILLYCRYLNNKMQ